MGDDVEQIVSRLNAVTELLQLLVAIELWRSGATYENIGKQLHARKATVGEMLKGLRREA